MSEEVAASIGDVLAENERLKRQLAQIDQLALMNDSGGDPWRECERLRALLVQAEERARIASEAYHQQQDAQREHEARYQAAVERAQAAEAEGMRLRKDVVKWRMMVDFQAKMLTDETTLSDDLLAIAKAHHANCRAALDAARRLIIAWRAERQRRQVLADALQGLLDEPYGCPLCDCGRTRNPAKGHTDDCPYEIARAVLNEARSK